MKRVQPPMIEYNLKERGRMIGNDREYNISAICDNINGAMVQERIKNREMLGFYGHQARQLFGFDPTEAGEVKGVYNQVQPSIVTTKLQAFKDGTIKHKTEFLDCKAGNLAREMFANKVGGFSAVIDTTANNLLGFDYVLSPNYNGNRGYSFDSTKGDIKNLIKTLQEETDDFSLELINKLNEKINMLSISLDSAQIENSELLSEIVRIDKQQSVATIDLDATNSLMQDVTDFTNEKRLVGYIDEHIENKEAYQSLSLLAGVL